jgi:hypothetical protein
VLGAPKSNFGLFKKGCFPASESDNVIGTRPDLGLSSRNVQLGKKALAQPGLCVFSILNRKLFEGGDVSKDGVYSPADL